jgi:hypothetical protein
MSNTYTTGPMVITTDFSNYRTSAGVSSGVRILKLMLVVAGSTATAGQVTITLPSNSQALYPPINVTTSNVAYSIVLNDNLTGQAILSWQNFAVTGVTATGTVLYLWTSSSGASAS